MILSAAVISSMLPAGAVWLEPFIGAIAGIITIHLPTLCGADPAADPGLTGADVLSLVALGPGPLTADAYARFTQLVERYAWFTFCECSTAPTPSPPAFPSAPTGLPAINPPGLVGAGGAPCGNFGGSASTSVIATEILTGTQVDQTGLPTDDQVVTLIPVGATTVDVTANIANDGVYDAAHLTATTCQIDFYTSAHAAISAHHVTTTISGTLLQKGWIGHDTGIPIPATAAYFNLLFRWAGGTTTATVTMTATFNCPGSGIVPITGAPTCCSAADPYTSGQLTQILQLVTLIQRYLAPFAYVPGASHSGLTGSGILTIPTSVGVLITLTTTPTSVGIEAGSPDELWSAGWVSWGTSAGFSAREFISHSPQLSIPRTSSSWTRLGYTLTPGVVATIQELYAET